MLSKNQRGSILVEAIVATAILSIVIAASLPPIILAVVSRIESRRVSESIQLAQQQIDSVRELFNTGTYVSTNLPPSNGYASVSYLSSTAAPTDITTCTANPCSSATQAAVVYLNSQPFLVQTFRSSGVARSTVDSTVTYNSASDVPIAFRMGVRVYSPAAYAYFKGGGTLSSNQTNSSIGLQSSASFQNQAPQIVLYVDFVQGNLSKSQQAYQYYLQNQQ
jgi:type II secretory pathway pseudopilin PulG